MKNISIVLLSIIFIFARVDGISGAEIWREDSFADFADGTFGDGGANTYVSAAGRIQTVNRWDANGDGTIDLVMSNSHNIAEALDMSIYWGNGADFDARRRTHVPADGARWAAPADLDGDGRMDLAVANFSNGSWNDMDSFVYYGGDVPPGSKAWGSGGFGPFSRKIALPTKSAEQTATGDFNRDGHMDIVFAQSGGYWEYRHSDKEFDSPSRIYWGSDAGFDRERFTDLPADGACDVAATDLNGDEWIDLIFANRGASGTNDVDSMIYWGAPEGYDAARRTELPTHKASAVAIADIDNDGDADVIFANP